MRTLKQYILEEMPKHYSGEIVYQKDSKFIPISIRNVSDYITIAENAGLLYCVHPQQMFGYVFNVEDLQTGKQSVVPAMHLSLRDTPIKGYKQVHNLRIQEKYSKTNVATIWYTAYVKKFGGVVSDKEHLQGGKLLWKSFIKRATEDSTFNVSLVNFNTGAVLMPRVDTDTPDDQIWSRDDSKTNNVLVFEKQ